MSKFLKDKADHLSAQPEKIKGNAAAKIICEAPAEDANVVGFDKVEAERLGLQSGHQVSVAPTDEGTSYRPSPQALYS